MELSIPRLASKIPTEAAAYEFLEELRWNGQPVCSHCGSVSDHRYLAPTNGVSRATGPKRTMSERRVWKCRDCKKQFSAITGTVMQGSKISIRTWLFVIFEMVSNKNGVASREIERRYDLHPKTAWTMLHRIREAMANSEGGLFNIGVIADETYIGGDPKNRHGAKRRDPKVGRGTDKVPVLTLIEDHTGEVRSAVVPNVSAKTLGRVISENVELATTALHTDKWSSYIPVGQSMAAHYTVDHSVGQFVTEKSHGTNKAENYFSQLKRSLDGTHHHVTPAFLPRYLGEFDFRYSTRDISDTQRMARLMGQVAR